MIPARLVARALMASTLMLLTSACGESGIDRKLDFSETQAELEGSYGKALVEATPDQQYVLRTRRDEILARVLSVATPSNPDLVDSWTAHKTAEEFQRIREISVRELLLEHLDQQMAELGRAISALEDFRNGNSLRLAEVNAESLTPASDQEAEIRGTITLQNASSDFDVDLRGCKLTLSIDGRRIDDPTRANHCNGFRIIKSNGGQEKIDFSFRLSGRSNIDAYQSLIRDRLFERISWQHTPLKASFAYSAAGGKATYTLADGQLAALRQDLTQAMVDINAIKAR